MLRRVALVREDVSEELSASIIRVTFVPPMCEPVADAATDIPCDRYGCRLHRRDILRPSLFCVPERDDGGREAVQELGIYELVYVT
jgi:hypothetical protein